MKISKNRKIILIVIIIFIFLASIVYLLRPIAKSELIEVRNNNTNRICFEPSSSLKWRCSLFGGEINLVVVGTGGSIDVYEIGCFPGGETNDNGKYCKSNTDCQGYCIENSFCSFEKPEKSCYYCSSYKKPFFTFKRVGGSTGLPLLCK